MGQIKNVLIGLIAGFLFVILPAISGTIAYRVALAFDHSKDVSFALGGICAFFILVICIYLYLAYCRRFDRST